MRHEYFEEHIHEHRNRHDAERKLMMSYRKKVSELKRQAQEKHFQVQRELFRELAKLNPKSRHYRNHVIRHEQDGRGFRAILRPDAAYAPGQHHFPSAALGAAFPVWRFEYGPRDHAADICRSVHARLYISDPFPHEHTKARADPCRTA